MNKTTVTVEYFKTGSNRKFYTSFTYYSDLEPWEMPNIIEEVKTQTDHDKNKNFTVEVEKGNAWNKVLVIIEQVGIVPIKMKVSKETEEFLNSIAHVITDELGNRSYIVNGNVIKLC